MGKQGASLNDVAVLLAMTEPLEGTVQGIVDKVCAREKGRACWISLEEYSVLIDFS